MSDMPIKEDTQPYVPSNPALMRQAEPRKRGCGCWVTGIVTLLVAAVLVGVGLFLPPVNLYDRLFGVQYAMLDAQTNAVAAEGLTLIVNPADAGQNFGVALEPVTMAEMRANANNASVQAANVAVAAAPPYLALQSPVYKIHTTGSDPAETTLSVNVPPTAGNPDLLDLYAWDEEAMAWTVVPSQ